MSFKEYINKQYKTEEKKLRKLCTKYKHGDKAKHISKTIDDLDLHYESDGETSSKTPSKTTSKTPSKANVKKTPKPQVSGAQLAGAAASRIRSPNPPRHPPKKDKKRKKGGESPRSDSSSSTKSSKKKKKRSRHGSDSQDD